MVFGVVLVRGAVVLVRGVPFAAPVVLGVPAMGLFATLDVLVALFAAPVTVDVVLFATLDVLATLFAALGVMPVALFTAPVVLGVVPFASPVAHGVVPVVPLVKPVAPGVMPVGLFAVLVVLGVVPARWPLRWGRGEVPRRCAAASARSGVVAGRAVEVSARCCVASGGWAAPGRGAADSPVPCGGGEPPGRGGEPPGGDCAGMLASSPHR